MSYNGYKNYETWNVSLWIQNDESLYQLAKLCTDYKDFLENISEFDSKHTPDGVSWRDSKLDTKTLNEVVSEC